MRCDEFELQWQELLDRRLEPDGDAALAAHAAECGRCRHLSTSLRDALKSLQAVDHGRPDLSARIVAALAVADGDRAEVGATAVVELPPRNSLDAHGRTWHWWAAAAAVMLVAGAFWRLGFQAVDGPGRSDIVAVPPAAAPVHGTDLPAVAPTLDVAVAADESEPAWEELAEQSRVSAWQLADNTKRSVNDALAIAALWGEDDVASQHPTDDATWYQGVADGVAPLTESTLGTWKVLRGLVAPEGESRS